jgi:alanyl-tRNA synthetase
MRHAHLLGAAEPLIWRLVPTLVAEMGAAYPELVRAEALIKETLRLEETRFRRTLDRGLTLLDEATSGLKSGATLAGDVAFRLYDTYGFPLDLTLEAARDAGLDVDVDGFESLMGEQRERSRAAVTGNAGDARDAAAALASAHPPAEFVGHDRLTVETEIVALRRLDGDEALLKLAESPFYAAGGGQISDSGSITGPVGAAEVLDVLRVGDDQVIHARITGDLAEGERVTAAVDAGVRRATEANHTATHLLNWALRERLGAGVRQAGSYVGPDKLRFDFTHRGRVPQQELERIERMVNERVRADDPVGTAVMARAEADAAGAIGLFEEKYGERVRVVSAGDYSRELCGGTHVSRTGEIGAFKLVSEGSIGAGARRVEALTGGAVVDWYREREAALVAELAGREARIAELERDLRGARTTRVDPEALAVAAERAGAIRWIADEVPVDDADELLALSDRVRRLLGESGAVVLGARSDGKAMLVANFSEAAVASGLSAADVIREIAPIVDGGGGGKPAMARAGGRDASRLDEALAAAAEAIRSGVAA